MNDQTDLVTGQEAAALLKCSVAYLYQLAKEGKLERVPQRTLIGGSRQPLRFRRSQVMQVAREAGRLEDEIDPHPANVA